MSNGAGAGVTAGDDCAVVVAGVLAGVVLVGVVLDGVATAGATAGVV